MSESPFALAIEVGGSHIVVAAAPLTQSEQTEVALRQWGHVWPTAPALAYLTDDDTLLFGDEAAQRAAADPARAVANFTRRLGDDIPFVIDGCALPAAYLYAKAVAWVIDTVTDAHGVAPAAIALTHPAHWGEHRLATLRDALREQGIGSISTVPAAKAVAMHHDLSHPLESGDTLAVYDLGAETVESVVLRKRHDGHFDIIGDAVHIDGIGGARFEDAVLDHVVAAAGLDLASLASPPDAWRLREEVRTAKETLSAHPDATISLPAAASVRITRAEFENSIVDDVDQSLDAVTQAIDSAELTHSDLSAIVLAGGSSRIPFVAQRLADRFERPIVGDQSPEASAVLGAAYAGLAELRAAQALEQLADEAIDESADEAQRFSPAFARATRRRSAHRKGSFILPTTVIVLLAGTLVVVGAAALGDTRVDPFRGTTPLGDTFGFDGTLTAPSFPDAREDTDESTNKNAIAPAPDADASAATPNTKTRSPQAVRPPMAPQRPGQSSLIAQQPPPSAPTASAAMGPPAKSPSTPTSTTPSVPETPADPQAAQTPPPSTHPTTPPADPSPPLDPEPEPAPVADPPPTSDPPTEPAPQDPVPQDPAPQDPAPQDPVPQDPVQEQPPGVQTN